MDFRSRRQQAVFSAPPQTGPPSFPQMHPPPFPQMLPPPHAAPLYHLFPPPPHVAGAPYQPPAVMTAPAPVTIRKITAETLVYQMDFIRKLLMRFPFIAVDVEYPGAVHRPAAGRRDGHLTPDERYALLKANVDELPILQLGITLSDAHGNLPVNNRHGGVERIAWEVVFSDFDARRDRHVAESIAFLREQGLDLDAAREHGATSAAMREKLCHILSLPRGYPLTWVCFGGMYDLGYLLKIITGEPLPATKEEFLAQVKAHLGERVFDGKYMAEHCGRDDLRDGGLKWVARNLGVPLPSRYLAGTKSLLACRIFTAMTRWCVSRGACHKGLVDGLQ